MQHKIIRDGMVLASRGRDYSICIRVTCLHLLGCSSIFPQTAVSRSSPGFFPIPGRRPPLELPLDGWTTSSPPTHLRAPSLPSAAGLPTTTEGVIRGAPTGRIPWREVTSFHGVCPAAYDAAMHGRS